MLQSYWFTEWGWVDRNAEVLLFTSFDNIDCPLLCPMHKNGLCFSTFRIKESKKKVGGSGSLLRVFEFLFSFPWKGNYFMRSAPVEKWLNMILIHSSDTWDHTITRMLERMRWDLEISIMEEVTPEMRVSYRSSIYFERGPWSFHRSLGEWILKQESSFILGMPSSTKRERVEDNEGWIQNKFISLVFLVFQNLIEY